MQVLLHHIYEYKKGLRNLVLHTLDASMRELAEKKLSSQSICYLIREVTPTKINIFFGASACVDVVKQFGDKTLNNFTPEEDFILGTMLGYDRLQQCRRYIDFCKKKNKTYEDVWANQPFSKQTIE
jgi:hypothetical protein